MVWVVYKIDRKIDLFIDRYKWENIDRYVDIKVLIDR